MRSWPKFETELKDLFIIIVVLGFCFSFRWSGPETLSSWLFNFLIATLLVAISVGFHELVHTLVAEKMSAKVKMQVWSSGILIAILSTILSNGLIVFAAPFAVAVYPSHFIRFGHGGKNFHLGPYERAKIALAGPLANIGLAIIAKMLVPLLGSYAILLMKINVMLAIFNLFPFFTILPGLATQQFGELTRKRVEIPYVEGEFIFFGSRLLWVFSFAFIIVLGLGLFYLSIFFSLILALMTAICLFFVWYSTFESK